MRENLIEGENVCVKKGYQNSLKPVREEELELGMVTKQVIPLKHSILSKICIEHLLYRKL